MGGHLHTDWFRYILNSQRAKLARLNSALYKNALTSNGLPAYTQCSNPIANPGIHPAQYVVPIRRHRAGYHLYQGDAKAGASGIARNTVCRSRQAAFPVAGLQICPPVFDMPQCRLPKTDWAVRSDPLCFNGVLVMIKDHQAAGKSRFAGRGKSLKLQTITDLNALSSRFTGIDFQNITHCCGLAAIDRAMEYHAGRRVGEGLQQLPISIEIQ